MQERRAAVLGHLRQQVHEQPVARLGKARQVEHRDARHAVVAEQQLARLARLRRAVGPRKRHGAAHAQVVQVPHHVGGGAQRAEHRARGGKADALRQQLAHRPAAGGEHHGVGMPHRPVGEADVKATARTIGHVKPHGALYNMAAKDEKLARAIVEGICEVDDRLTLLALSGSEMLLAAEKAGLRAASEVFADRAYQANGTLVPRSQPGAMITDENEAIARVVRMVTEGVVTSIDGIDVPLRADSICVHGDGEKALLFVQKIRAALEEKGVALKAL